MGSMFSSSQTTNQSQQQTNTDGQAWQQPYYQELSQYAQGIYNNQAGNTTYNGQLYNPINSQETSAANNLYGYGTSLGSNLSGLLSAGNEGLSGMSGYETGANNFANGNFNQGSTSAGILAAGNTGGALSQYNTAMNNALTGSDAATQTANDMATAQQYASNPQLQALINSNTQSIANTLNNSTLPSLNAQAIAAGGLNSSRAGAASATAASQAEQNAQNYAAQLQNNAYNTGASLGQTAQAQAQNTNLSAANAANSDIYSGISGMSAANNQTNANNNLMYDGTNLLGQGASLGSGLLSSYGTNAANAGNLQYSGGGILQNDGQMADNAALEQYQMNMQQPWTTLDNLQNIVGQSYGSSGTMTGSSKTTYNPQHHAGH